jgi:hypothetical protein
MVRSCYRGVRVRQLVSPLARKHCQRNHSTIIVHPNRDLLQREHPSFNNWHLVFLRKSSSLTNSIEAPVPQTIGNMVDVETILKGKYPAKAHVKRVVEWMKTKNPDVKGVLYLEGQKTRMIEDNDETMPFRFVLQLPPLPHLSPH